MSAMEMGFFAIPVGNIEKAKSFYGSVMGWTFNDRDADFSYIFANENMIGALETASGEFMPSATGPLLFFRAELMGETLERVKSNGGTVKEKLAMNGGESGYTAKVSDPSNNTIGFWAPTE